MVFHQKNTNIPHDPPWKWLNHCRHLALTMFTMLDSSWTSWNSRRGPCFCRKIIGMCEAYFLRTDETSEVSTICVFWPQNDGFSCKLLWLQLNSRPILWTFNKHQGFVVHVWVQTSQKLSPILFPLDPLGRFGCPNIDMGGSSPSIPSHGDVRDHLIRSDPICWVVTKSLRWPTVCSNSLR